MTNKHVTNEVSAMNEKEGEAMALGELIGEWKGKITSVKVHPFSKERGTSLRLRAKVTSGSRALTLLDRKLTGHLAGSRSPHPAALPGPNSSRKKGEPIMKTATPLTLSVLLATLVVVFAAQTARAQDAVTVDPKHYKVEFENDQVRVLRVTYGPHEKSVMHEHPAGVAVFLTENHGKFTYPDGKTEEFNAKAGEPRWNAGGKHLPENLSDKPFELVLVELKAKPARAAKRSATPKP